jgi:hypothetical protein
MDYNHIKDLYNKKRLLELEWEQKPCLRGFIYFKQVRIDEEIRNTISLLKWLKQERFLHQVKVESVAAPEFSIAG